jgi:hypothetical protein
VELDVPVLASTDMAIVLGSVAEPGFIARVAGRLAGFHAQEEGFVDPMQDILQDLGVDGSQFDVLTFGTTIYNNHDTRAKSLTGEVFFVCCYVSSSLKLGYMGYLLF